jgi:hypothetical protein
LVGSNLPDPEIDVGLLTAIAAAIRDREQIRFDDRDEEHWRQVQPYRLISWQRRWYLVGRTARTDAWSTYRRGWMRLRTRGAPRFTRSTCPGATTPPFVLREVAFAGWRVHTRIRVDAPATEVLARINPAVAVVGERYRRAMAADASAGPGGRPSAVGDGGVPG